MVSKDRYIESKYGPNLYMDIFINHCDCIT